MTCLCSEFGPAGKITVEEARKIGNNLGVDWKKIALEQFRQGLEVELEHGCRSPETNVTCDDPILTGKIALAHLKEMPDYYDKLKTIEPDYDKPLAMQFHTQMVKELADLSAMKESSQIKG